MAASDKTPRRSIKRNGDVFVDSRYAGRVTRSGRRLAAEYWLRSARLGHESLGDCYRTRDDAAAAIVWAYLAGTGR